MYWYVLYYKNNWMAFIHLCQSTCPWLWTQGTNPSDVYLVEAIGDLRIQKTTSGIA